MPERPAASSVKSAVAVTLAVLMVVGLGAGVVWLTRPGDEPEERRAEQTQSPNIAARRVEPATTILKRPTCSRGARSFAPRTITVAGATRGAPVITPPRDAEGIPGVAPLNAYGKSVFAWDREQGTRPGDPRGNVLLNAHTWPDGSALGNRLLAALHKGDRIVVHGARARLCYRVTEEVEVLAEDGLPRYYTIDGPPQLAILVCSGRRLGPGLWEKRTVWFASPLA